MSRKIMFVSLFVLLFPLLYARFNMVNVQANNGYTVHNLDTNLNYTTIQEAIDANETDDGHTILVDAGIYYEHVVVNKSISLFGQDRNTTIVDGSVNRTVVSITKDNVNVTGFTIQNSGDYPEGGFYLDNVSYCHITGNNMANNSGGMRMWNSSNNVISGNNITNNKSGIYIIAGSSNNITGNDMLDNYWSIGVYDSSTDNIIYGNNMVNRGYGINLYPYSSNNTISGNNITSYFGGIRLDRASDNRFYHNNFIDNIDPVVLDVFSDNFWDNGVEGNYWSNYIGVDLLDGGDGIGDSPYDIDDDNTDRFPLMGPISFFDAGTWDKTTYYVHTVSNSTVSDFFFNPDMGAILRFNVTGSDSTTGFSRVAVPKRLLWVENEWTVLVGGGSVVPKVAEDVDYTYLYFTYNHSTQTVTIQGTYAIPELSSFLILPLLMITTLLTAIFHKRQLKKEAPVPP